ncbi:MAG: NADP-dependent phosphogluconate dehydrogenase [Myxococcales bacterium]|nr:NADP-dependent phosphogluconate dehydrogenase [Myxococcales bacterium]
MTDRKNDVAVIGMGVMGANLARNFASRGLAVGAYNRTYETAQKLAEAHPEAKLDVVQTLKELVARLERPRRIVVLVNAGTPVDAVINELDPLLEAGDIVIDAGNSLYTDSDRRAANAKGKAWRFVGMGVSGGSEGALKGPSLMPGGDVDAWERLKPVLEPIAARSSSGLCVAHCGLGSAGHFVKMVHNGIEYGDMQLIAETALLLRGGLGLDGAAVADTFSKWNQGDLSSFLIEITADIFKVKDLKLPDALLVDAILDKAGQKGTGKWTVVAAAELGIAIPTITAAVDARILSSQKDTRVKAEAAHRPTRARLTGVSVDDLAHALYASKIASYTQGFQLLRAASTTFKYGTKLSEIARIWTAGCIIRASFLERIQSAFAASPEPELLALAPEFVSDLAKRLPSWRRVVSAASLAGVAIPGLATSLAWYDTLTTARGSANLIQAQRDFFGSHTYERVDAPGVAVHTEWSA